MKVFYLSVPHQIDFTVKEDFDISIFPKYLKVRRYNCYTDEGKKIYVGIAASLSSDEVNKGKNEQGMKRLEKFLKVMKKHFSNLEFVQYSFVNNIDLPQELQSIINS